MPIFIGFIGVEAYGLVGFFATLQATAQLLEFGMTSTLNRELARHAAREDHSATARDLARTLELVFWAVGALVVAAVLLGTPLIAEHWLQASPTLSTEVIASCISMMGIALAFQWPVGLYGGGMMGLERQVLHNTVVIACNSLRGAGAVLTLWLVEPSIVAFFVWQVIASLIQVTITATVFWRCMPAGRRARFDLQLLKGVWSYTAGVGATGVLTFALSQLDKVLLSNLLPLSQFGHYTIANQGNRATRMATHAIFTALFPRASALFEQQDEAALRLLYHRGCQLVALVTFPAAAVIALFSHDLLLLWTQNAEVAAAAAPITSVLVLGSALNSAVGLPYSLTVSSGWVRFGVYQNLIAAVLFVPVMYYLTTRYGGMGAASAWVMLNAGYLLVSMPIIHRRLLQGELRAFYLVDLGRPVVVSFAVAGAGRWLVPADAALWQRALSIVMIGLCALALSGLTLPHVRRRVLDRR